MFSPVLFIRLCILVSLTDRNFCFIIQEAHVLRVFENKVQRGTFQLKIEKPTVEKTKCIILNLIVCNIQQIRPG